MNIATLNEEIRNHKIALGLAQQALVEACQEHTIALRAFLDAKRNLAKTEATGYLKAQGPAHERKPKMILAAEEAQLKCDIAETMEKAARDQKDIAKAALENARAELSAIQSQVKLFETEANLTRSGF